MPILAFFGVFIGIIISKFTRDEVRNNRNYILILSKLIILILIFTIIFFSNNFSLLFIGVLIGFLSAYILSEFLFLGLQLGLSLFLQKEIILVTSLLVFMYSMLYGSLIRVVNINFSKLFILFLMFFLPLSMLLFEKILMIDLIIGFIAGGLSNYLIGHKFSLI